MKKLLLALALTSIAATPALAQLNLSWDFCITHVAATANRNYACDGSDTGLLYRIVPSFIAPAGITHFVGVDQVTIELSTTSPTLPDFWRLGAGECRAGGIDQSSFFVGVTGIDPACKSPFAGSTVSFDNSWISATPTPDRAVWTASATRQSATPLVPGQQYIAGRYDLFPFGDEPLDGLGDCPGCEIPACLELKSLVLVQEAPLANYLINVVGTRNFITWQGGTPGCAAATPARKHTWGAIKSIYR